MAATHVVEATWNAGLLRMLSFVRELRPDLNVLMALASEERVLQTMERELLRFARQHPDVVNTYLTHASAFTQNLTSTSECWPHFVTAASALLACVAEGATANDAEASPATQAKMTSDDVTRVCAHLDEDGREDYILTLARQLFGAQKWAELETDI